MIEQIKIRSPTLDQFKAAKADFEKKHKPEDEGFFGKIKNFISGDDKTHDIKISGPKNFKHNSSLSFNTETAQFDIESLPGVYKEIFKKAGITKKDLLNPETAKEIFS